MRVKNSLIEKFKLLSLFDIKILIIDIGYKVY